MPVEGERSAYDCAHFRCILRRQPSRRLMCRSPGKRTDKNLVFGRGRRMLMCLPILAFGGGPLWAAAGRWRHLPVKTAVKA